MEHAILARFGALDTAFHARAPRGEVLQARFAALAALNAPLDVETLIEKSFETRDQLNAGLGPWRSPSRPMRLVFAAALVAGGRTAQQFLETRRALALQRKARGARGLAHGGSCAALSLVTAGGQAWQADQFYDVLDAIAAPWWQRDAPREEVLAAAFTAMGETPEDAVNHLTRARQALITAGVPHPHAMAAAYEVATTAMDPAALAGAWTSLNIAVRGRSALRHGTGKTGLAILAASGNGPAMADALVQAFEAVGELKPKPTSQTAARLALRLAQAQAGLAKPIAAAGDLAAILAAQAAMVAAVTASTGAVAVGAH
ncbi:hypothetical protein [uncultured Maricaulis sp.]|uniref:hypothetical protein n=1 Tax=uncultured Maricaulis sp. TaxID=174710 RepID=UPI0030DAB8D4|tara:strand:- start:19253 stop:20203 length:951 start_codon:yes stop_codon:yes gene_type:complete